MNLTDLYGLVVDTAALPGRRESNRTSTKPASGPMAGKQVPPGRERGSGAGGEGTGLLWQLGRRGIGDQGDEASVAAGGDPGSAGRWPVVEELVRDGLLDTETETGLCEDLQFNPIHPIGNSLTL